ncbi:hypothetical protein JAAARDRAFT_31964 [Jaapia argillacea MUCL 33604]|uniref:Uncharacterized protein n=1 Tax=Jaapia argillacea MUCL 33604 TaxID=933084 RepID=A0A067QEF4_9AGAM|nr:hypothetical protein JAAARDRAFT_31964 [Jaapia argillacea MUCL 33604]
MVPSFKALSLAGAASLLLFLQGVGAQTTNAVCMSTYAWSDNSRGQSPCLVAAYLQGACNGGQYTVDALPANTHYIGPTLALTNQCQCSTVTYSLMSACGSCQNRTIETWSTWSFNCSSVYVGVYPQNIPLGTAVPAWAYLDVTKADIFDPAAAEALNAPESTATSSKPTGSLTSSGPSSGTASSTTTGPPSSTSTAAGKKSNTGAIAGGVVAGVVVLALIVAGVAFYLMRKRRADRNAPSAMYGVQPPMSDAGYSNPPYIQQPAPMTPSKYYDPSDPSTFPPSPVGSPTIHTTSSGYAGYPRPGQYTGVPEL